MAQLVNKPLLKKELRQALRGHGALIAQNVYLIAFFVIAVAAASSHLIFSTALAWRAGSAAFWAVMMTQAVLAIVVIPGATASVMTTEHEQKTYDTLASTPLTSSHIIWSKMLGYFVISGSIMVVSVPIGAACFLLGGVPLAPALLSLVVLCGAIAFATALGVYCSTLAKRTAAAVPKAVCAGLVVLLLFGMVGQGAPVLGAVSPLGAMNFLSREQPVPVFNLAVPVWLASLLFWAVAVLALAEAGVQRIQHLPHQRLWGVRWRVLLLFAMLAFAALGSVQALGETATPGCAGGACCGTGGDTDPEKVPQALAIFAAIIGHVLVALVPLFAAGLLTPLDKRRIAGEKTKDYSIWERMFGLSLDAGARYVMLLALLTLVIALLGMLLWGGEVFGDHWDAIVLGFVPIFAAVWALSMGTRIIGFCAWPRSDFGRKLVCVLLFGALILVSVCPAYVLARDVDEPTFASELSLTPVLAAGVVSAFHISLFEAESAAMKALTEWVPMPVITTVLYVALGILFLLAKRRMRQIWIRRQAAAQVSPPLPEDTHPAPSTPDA